MPVIKCNNCGGTTNTALSDYELRDINKGASRCYAKYEDNKWVEGCAYSVASELFKNIADKMMERR